MDIPQPLNRKEKVSINLVADKFNVRLYVERERYSFNVFSLEVTVALELLSSACYRLVYRNKQSSRLAFLIILPVLVK